MYDTGVKAFVRRGSYGIPTLDVLNGAGSREPCPHVEVVPDDTDSAIKHSSVVGN